MSATLTFSNSLDALADRLLENLARTGGDPFATVAIATPASALRDWLKVRIAERAGIAANLAFPPLERLLWDHLAARDRYREDPTRQPARLLDGFSFQGLVLTRLRENPPEALRDYLESAQPEDAARRLVQLAGQLASLFREYEYNRVAESHYPSLTDSWRKGETNFERHLLRGASAKAASRHLDEVREMEAWQMDIYRSLFRPGGLRDQWGEERKVYRYTLAQYADMALEDPLTPADGDRVTHLFGLSNISPFHRDLIGRLADENKLGAGAARFEIYALNPCAEYWEDLLSLRERRARGARGARAERPLAPSPVPPARVAATRPDAFELEAGELREAPDENGLLALFGKPGRETIKLWCQLTEHDFNEDFREPLGGPSGASGMLSLLGEVQASALRRAGPRERRVAPDASLRFLAAANPRAEIEGVRAEIAAALRADPTLRPEDMAVIPADPAASLTLLRAVFAGDERAPGNVPLLFPDGGAAAEGPVLTAFKALLDLATGEVTRESLLQLLGNPVVLRASGLEIPRVSLIADFLDEAGFRRGWEEASDGVSSLGAALDRAILSFALDGDDPVLGTDRGATDLPQPVPGVPGRLERSEAGKLLAWLEALTLHLSPLRASAPGSFKRSFKEWASHLRQLRDIFIKPDAGDGRDARDDLDLRRFLEELEAWGAGSGEDGASADITLISMLFSDRFRGEEGPGRSTFLRGGVRTGSLSALRGIPFRHVWITGLSGEFPSAGDAIPLDLRAFRRLPGESDPASRDLYALLEVLVASTGSVTLSWPRRGADGKERQPSRALTGLMAWLESDILPAGAAFDFEDMIRPAAPPPLPVERSRVSYASEAAPRSVQKLRALEAFLSNPVLQFTERALRTEDRELLDDREAGLSEDLFVGRWEARDLLDACLRAELLEEGSAAGLFDRLWTQRKRAGKLPPAPWGAFEETRLREEDLASVIGEAASLRRLLDAQGMRFWGSLRIGPQGAERPDAPVINVPPFDTSSLGIELRWGGVLPWFFRGPEGWALLVTPGRDLTAYLVQLCSIALAPLPSALHECFAGRGRLFVRTGNGGDVREFPLPEWDVETARETLARLLGDYAAALRAEGHLDDVPLESIHEILEATEGGAEAVTDWEEALSDLRRRAEESGWQQVSRRERLRRAVDPAFPRDLESVIRGRLLPYLRWHADLAKTADNPDGPADGEGEAA